MVGEAAGRKELFSNKFSELRRMGFRMRGRKCSRSELRRGFLTKQSESQTSKLEIYTVTVPKLEKAKELGIPVITEEELLAMTGGYHAET